MTTNPKTIMVFFLGKSFLINSVDSFTIKCYFFKNMTHTIAQLYKVVKIMRISARRKVLARNKTLADAQSIVKNYKSTSRSMVSFFAQ